MRRKKKEEKVEQDVQLEENQPSNEELYSQLTKKNADYIFNLNRKLVNFKMPEVDRESKINEMMQTIIEEQGKGKTARALYGTVRDQARYIAADYVGDKADAALTVDDGEVSEDWKLYIDGALLIGGVYSIVTGLTYFMSDTPELVGTGWFTLLMNFVLGGLVMLAVAKNVPRQGQKGGFLRYFLVSFVAILLWVIAMALITAFIPAGFNAMLPGWAILVIGIIALVAKWYLKKRLNIKGTMI